MGTNYLIRKHVASLSFLSFSHKQMATNDLIRKHVASLSFLSFTHKQMATNDLICEQVIAVITVIIFKNKIRLYNNAIWKLKVDPAGLVPGVFLQIWN